MKNSEVGVHETPSHSPNFQTEFAERIGEIAPEAIADGKIDIEKIRELLGFDGTDDKERFGLFWPGKKRALKAAQESTTATLAPDLVNSKNWTTTKNIFIEGDNLEVLKILQKHYHGKIGTIYIDPPYNTGKDFVYPDNYIEGLDSYLEWTRQVNDEGKKVTTNAESDGRFHSNWLNMMYPRLKLARNLLTQDGVIFISIDDNELDNLIKLCHEIFGESNYISTLAVEMSKTQGMKVAAAQNGQIVKNHEYVLVYARNSSQAFNNRKPLFDASEVYDSHYDIIWESGKDSRTLTEVLEEDSRSVQSFNQFRFKIGKTDLKRLLEIDREYYEYFLANIAPKLYRESPISLENVQQLDLPVGQIIEWEKYILKKNSRGTVAQLQPFLDGVRQTDDYSPSRTRATIRGALWKGFHSDMMNLGKEGGVEFKNGKKPIRLVQQLVKWANRPDSIVLDFFAGSGTTAEAVIRANTEDGGSRSYILVQLPEPIEENLKISDITRERIGKIEVEAQLGREEVDTGFRAYKLCDTNFAKWHVVSNVDSNALEQHLLDLRQDSESHASRDGLLTEILLKQGYSLVETITELSIEGLVFKVLGESIVIAYLDASPKPSFAQLRKVVELKPARLIFLEEAFQGDDELKTNLAQECSSNGIELWTV